MIRPPSVQSTYDEFWPGDPAFVQLADDATDAQRKEHAKRIEVARDTGDWSGLRVEGGSEPTKFVMRQVDRVAWRTLQDRMQMDESSSRFIGANEGTSLLFRMALESIENLGDFKVTRGIEDGIQLAARKAVTYLDQISPAIVIDLGNAVFRRLVAPSPKS